MGWNYRVTKMNNNMFFVSHLQTTYILLQMQFFFKIVWYSSYRCNPMFCCPISVFLCFQRFKAFC